MLFRSMFDDQKAAEIHVLQGEHSEVHRNRSIGSFLLDLKEGGGDHSKIIVRFDLTLDGTLNVTATQPATGISQELTINNALSQFQADERDWAETRLGAIFDASDVLLDDEDLPAPQQWATQAKRNSDAPDSANRMDPAAVGSRFPEAIALLRKGEPVKSSVDAEDAREIESLCEKLDQAMASDDAAAVASLCVELDDILFYVQ